jgi:hypothetical protein
MSKLKFTISFKNVTKDLELLKEIQKIENSERSRVLKEILYKVLVEGKEYEK